MGAITSFIKKVCKQDAVYWGTPVDDGYGTKTYATPVEIKVRWEDRLKTISDRDGREIVADITVLVTQDLDLGGYLYLGSLDDLDSDPVPADVEGAFEILSFEKIPMIFSTTEFVRFAYLNKQYQAS
jgi:hypothetical protein